jgi:glutamate dehydrogenase
MATISLRGWQGALQEALTARLGESRAMTAMARYSRAFPDGFHTTHRPVVASAWVSALEEYAGGTEPLLRLVVPDHSAAEQLDLDLDDGTRLLLLWPSPAPALLADVFPVLENLALRIAGHEAYEVRPVGRSPVRAEEFTLLPRDVEALKADPAVCDEVADTFRAVWSGRADNDGFNQLVLRAGLTWRETALLRAGFAYLRQAGQAFSQRFVERTLLTHKRVTRLLVALFRARLDPTYAGSTHEEAALADVETALASVENLSEDRLLRALVELVCAVLRTNYYQRDADGAPKPYLVVKLDSNALSFLPTPRPMVETFVYSTRMEGLHLRTAKVARGGLRWSDRTEDYRTEVLGLMKAQRVKNAVIVPHGAKGAFDLKGLPAGSACGVRDVHPGPARRYRQPRRRGRGSTAAGPVSRRRRHLPRGGRGQGHCDDVGPREHDRRGVRLLARRCVRIRRCQRVRPQGPRRDGARRVGVAPPAPRRNGTRSLAG